MRMMTTIAPLAIAIVMILVAFCGAADASEEGEAVALLNTLRSQNGLSPLHWDPSSRLQDAARVRAEELQRKFSHTRPDGRNCDSILKEYGFRYRRYGENIAYGTNLSASGVIKMWSRSPGHNENMMSPHFREIGLASFHGRNRNVYWVQIFLSK